MGAWGFGPFESDSALDWYDDNVSPNLRKMVSKIRKLAWKKHVHDYESIRSASEAFLIIHNSFESSFDIDEESSCIPDNLIASLQLIKKDRDWLESWDRPDLVKKDIGRQISQLKKLDSYQGSEREFPKYNGTIKIYHDEL